MGEARGGPAPAVAVFGAEGFIGGRLLRCFSRGNPASPGFAERVRDGLMECDLTRPDAHAGELKRRHVAVAVIAAAVTSVARCEADPEGTRRVNVEGVLELARRLHDNGIRVVFLSSDYVFDGTKGSYDERAAVNPVNEYGRQKAEAEKGLLDLCGQDGLVVRMSKVFDVERGGGRILDEMAGRLARGETVRAARDQVFCPTHVDDVAGGVTESILAGRGGIVHLCNPERVARYDLARRIAEGLGLPAGAVSGISLDELGEPFRRPKDTSMVSIRLVGAARHAFIRLQDSIDEVCGRYRGVSDGKAN